MARNYVRYRPNRGLNIVQPKAALNAGQCYRAENVVFTRKSVKRRRGKLASHKVALTSVSAAVTMLKRFYNLATTGTVSKVFLKAFGAVLYGTTTDWSDDTRTPITTAQWTNIPYPNTANNSLYDGYSSVTAEPVSGGIESAVASKSWCYIQSNVSSANDSAKTKGVPIRTQGGKAFLHGLVPPVALDQDDTGHDVAAGTVTWTTALVDEGTNQTGFGASIAVDYLGGIHVGYCLNDASSKFGVRYAFTEKAAVQGTVPTTWATQTVVSVNTNGPALQNQVSLAVDGFGNPHIVWVANTTQDLMYATCTRGGSSWTTETIDSTRNCQDPHVQASATGTVCVVYKDVTNNDFRYGYRPPGTGAAWVTEIADSTTSADTGDGGCLAIDSSGVVHASYYDKTNTNMRYSKRSSVGAGGTWGTLENVDTVGTDIGISSSIRLTSGDVPGILYMDTTSTRVKYAQRTGGTWSVVENAGSASTYATWTNRALVFDSADVPHGIWTSYSVADNRVYYGKKSGGTWASSLIEAATFSSNLDVSMAIDADDYLHVAYLDATNGDLRYAVGTLRDYYYRITAEYDDGVLGESSPSSATGVSLADAIDTAHTHVIALDTGTGVYDMTDDVSRIHIYRTLRDAGPSSTYYRVGSVTCSSGAPAADFTDSVSDTDLVANRILDVDRYMPPKWLTGVIWKDRMVIGNLKCRDISTSEGSVDSLDLEDTGIHKNRIRFSEAFHPDVYKANFFQDILPDGDSGSIKRLIVNPQSDSLFVFMENDVVALTDPVGDLVTALSYRPRNVANSHGTPARHSVVEYEGLIFYWTKNGIEVINGLTARNITSDTIGNLWNMTNSNHPAYASRINMSQISKVAGTAHVDEAGERIYWAYPAASNSYNNRVLVLDFARWRDSGFNDDGVFSIWTMDISCWARWDGEGDRGELFGGEALNTRGPWVHRVGISNQDEVGNTSGTITTSAVSPFYIHTGHDDAGTAERRKRWITARVDGRIPSVASTGSCSVALAFDVDEGAVSGTMDTVTWTQGGIKRYSRNLPRAAIGVHGAVEITGTDGTPGASGGSPPFELYEIAMTVQDMEARTARG